MDDKDKCGTNQVLWGDDARCVCAEGFVYSDNGCVPCGANEHADPVQGCACDDGYARPGPGAACEALPEGVAAPTGVGTPCTSDADCSGFDASYCEGVVSHTCLVPNCNPSPNDCFQGYECCPFNGAPGFETLNLPNLCLAAGLCTLL